MKTKRTWFPEDKAFLKRIKKMASRLVEEIEAPTMNYYGRLKVAKRLTSWRSRIAAVAESIDRDLEHIK